MGELITRYSPLIWSLARGMVPVDAAEDLVQEILIQLWSQADRYNPELAAEATFITMITRRRIIDHQRRVGRRPAAEELDLEMSVVDDALEQPELEDEARLALLAMRELKPDQQLVLKLSIIDGLSHRQISDRTHMPLGTVKSHARRGLEKIRATLGDRSDILRTSGPSEPSP